MQHFARVDEHDEETVPARDGCVVESAPLSLVLNGFVDVWQRTRPNDGYRGKKVDVSTVKAVEWLSAASGVSERAIRDLMKLKRPTTDLVVADALIAAIGCPQVFYDGTLEVRELPD